MKIVSIKDFAFFCSFVSFLMTGFFGCLPVKNSDLGESQAAVVLPTAGTPTPGEIEETSSPENSPTFVPETGEPTPTPIAEPEVSPTPDVSEPTPTPVVEPTMEPQGSPTPVHEETPRPTPTPLPDETPEEPTPFPTPNPNTVDNDEDGYSEIEGDCDDANSSIHPGAVERCNGIDDNCDDVVDPSSSEDVTTWYLDSDRDTYGDEDVLIVSCTAPSEYV